MRRFVLIPLLLIAGCGEAVEDDHFSEPIEQERPAPTPVDTEAVPVRIGEMGPSFAACNAAGTTRNLGDGGLDVRAAPFDTAAGKGEIAAGSRFFVCARSHDQRWMGVVFHDGGALDPACGVSAPVRIPRAYDGSCRSGWVSSAFVKLVAG